MSAGKCKAAIDCQGFFREVDFTVHLIINDAIVDERAIHVFNELKERWSKEWAEWKETFIDFEGA